MAGEKKLDMQVLATKDNLSDEDLKSIQDDVLAEEGIKSSEEETTKEEQPAGEEEDKGKEEESKEGDVEAAAEDTKKEEERLLNAKPEELSAEDKTKREEVVKRQDTEREQKVKEEIETEIKTYAAEHEISEDEARTDLESRSKILEKYKSDPKQLALANLHLQRLYAKTQDQLKAEKEAAPLRQAKTLTATDCLKLLDEGKITVKGKAITREEAISAYREQFPNDTENLDDDAVAKFVGKEIRDNYVKSQEQALANMTTEAKGRRVELINSLPEADKKFAPLIQPLIEKYPDAAILSENFKLDDLVRWAKGSSYDKDLKEFGEKEYKRGLEQAKIIGKKGNGTGSGSNMPKIKTKITLTEEQKKTALNMYEGTTFTDEEKFANYAEILEADRQREQKK